MIKAVIFDLDGTLIDTLDDLTDSMNFVLSEFCFPIRTKPEIRSFVGNGLGMLAKRSLPEESNDNTVREITTRMKEYYALHSRIKTKPYDSIPECLDEIKLKDIKCAVLTNKLESAAKSLCDDFFPEYFDIVCGDNGVDRLKPAPDGIERIAGQFNVEKDEILYIGDSEVDAETAINAGVKSIGVLWGFRDKDILEKCGFDEIADEVSDIIDIIKKNS